MQRGAMAAAWRSTAVCVLLAASAGAAASEGGGSVQGAVLDPAGLPVEDAVVQLEGEGMLGGSQHLPVSSDGSFIRGGLYPGGYVLVVSAKGFRDVRVEAVTVTEGRTTRVDVVTEPSAAEAGLPLVVQLPVGAVDPDATAVATDLDAALLERIPTTRQWQTVATLAPGAQLAPSQGEAAVPMGMVVNGQGPYANQFRLNGFDLTDPLTRQAGVNVNFDALQSVRLMTAARPAWSGGATGGVLSATTRRGSNTFFADASIYYQPDLAELSRRDVLNENSRLVPQGLGLYAAGEGMGHQTGLRLNANVGGPIIKDRLWFFVSNQIGYEQSSLATRSFPGRLAPREARSWAGLATLSYRPLPGQEFQVLLVGDPSAVSNALQLPQVHPDAEAAQTRGGSLVGLSSMTRLGNWARFQQRVGVYSAFDQEMPVDGDFSSASHSNLTSGAVTGQSPRLYQDVRNRVQYGVDFTVDWSSIFESNGDVRLMDGSGRSLSWLREAYGLSQRLRARLLGLGLLMGGHQTQVGVDASFSWTRRRQDVPGGASYLDVGAPGTDGLEGAPYQRVLQNGAHTSLFSGDTVGVYIQDTWKPIRSLTITPGLRLDSARWRDDHVNMPGGGTGGDFVGQQAMDARSLVAGTVAQFNILSPRFAVAWDPLNDGKTNIHAAWSRYADTGWLAIPSRTAKRPKTTTQTWDGTAWQDVPQEDGPAAQADPGMRGWDPTRLPQGAGDVDLSRPWAPSVMGFDPLQVFTGHHVPHVDEFVAGVDRELMAGLSVSAQGTLRVSSSLLEDVETNLLWNADGTQVLGGRNGKAQAVYKVGTPDEARQVYYGLALGIRKRLSDRFEGLVNYTFGVNRGTTDVPFSNAFNNPNAPGSSFGYLAYDRRHMLRVAGTYLLPWGFSVGGSAAYLSGAPYNAWRYNSFEDAYTDLAARRGTDPRNQDTQLRIDDQVQSSVRVIWDAKDVAGVHLWFIGDVSNVLNLRSVTGVEDRLVPAGAAPGFGDPISRQAPVQVNLGLRFQY